MKQYEHVSYFLLFKGFQYTISLFQNIIIRSFVVKLIKYLLYDIQGISI